MKIFDVTLPLSPDLVTSPGENFFALEFTKTFEESGANVSKLTVGNHNGTHVDAPLHFLKDGGDTTTIDPTVLVGPCQVLEVKPSGLLIEKADIEGRIKGERVIFKTTNSALLTQPFTADYISVGLSAAEYLVEQGVKLVGVDYFGCEAKGSPGHPVHTTLLKSQVVIVEGLNLSEVEQGEYEIFVGALKISGAEASSARVLLIVD